MAGRGQPRRARFRIPAHRRPDRPDPDHHGSARRKTCGQVHPREGHGRRAGAVRTQRSVRPSWLERRRHAWSRRCRRPDHAQPCGARLQRSRFRKRRRKRAQRQRRRHDSRRCLLSGRVHADRPLPRRQGRLLVAGGLVRRRCLRGSRDRRHLHRRGQACGQVSARGGHGQKRRARSRRPCHRARPHSGQGRHDAVFRVHPEHQPCRSGHRHHARGHGLPRRLLGSDGRDGGRDLHVALGRRRSVVVRLRRGDRLARGRRRDRRLVHGPRRVRGTLGVRFGLRGRQRGLVPRRLRRRPVQEAGNL